MGNNVRAILGYSGQELQTLLYGDQTPSQGNSTCSKGFIRVLLCSKHQTEFTGLTEEEENAI